MNKETYTLKEIEKKLEHEKYLSEENQQLYEELQVLRKCSDTTNDLANEYKKELERYKNIIDELEKYCWELKAMGCREGALDMLDKIKELKGE